MHKELQLKAQKTEAITQMGKEHEQFTKETEMINKVVKNTQPH